MHATLSFCSLAKYSGCQFERKKILMRIFEKNLILVDQIGYNYPRIHRALTLCLTAHMYMSLDVLVILLNL